MTKYSRYFYCVARTWDCDWMTNYALAYRILLDVSFSIKFCLDVTPVIYNLHHMLRSLVEMDVIIVILCCLLLSDRSPGIMDMDESTYTRYYGPRYGHGWFVCLFFMLC